MAGVAGLTVNVGDPCGSGPINSGSHLSSAVDGPYCAWLAAKALSAFVPKTPAIRGGWDDVRRQW